MKKILLYLALSVSGLFLLASCNKMLDTEPTDKVSGTTIFADAKGAQVAVDGIYSTSYRSQFGTLNPLQGFGHVSNMVATDMMGEDALMLAVDFYGMDYSYDYVIKADITTGGRNYVIWGVYYTFITNANYVIAQEGKIGGDENLAKNVVAQAYAIRAWSYFELIQLYQHTYLGSETKPGVPLYTEPTVAGSEGKGRGTVEGIYAVINSDLEKSVALFAAAGKTSQAHCSHIDYYIAKGLQARVALVQGRDQDAFNAASEALTRSGVALLPMAEVKDGITHRDNANSLWTMECKEDQNTVGNIGFIYYPAVTAGSQTWGARAPKCISNWLYAKIDAADARKLWWKDGNQGDAASGENVNYISWKKFPRNGGEYDADVMYMRAEEMHLIKAEAKARLGLYSDAKALLTVLMNERFTTDAAKAAYSTYLNGLTESASLQAVSTDAVITVMDEIILQRRIELWGEGFRHHDIQRLKIGFDRNYSGSNHTYKLIALEGGTGPQSKNFLFKIPQSEFNGNKNLTAADQNPL